MTARKPKTEINHKNNDPTDNTLDNLEFRKPLKTEGQPYHPDPLHPFNTPDGKDHRPSTTEDGSDEAIQRAPDGAAMTIMHGDETIGVWDRITPYRFRFDPAGYAVTPVTPAPNSIGQRPYRYEHGVDLTRWGSDRLVGQRPYVLESALVEQTLHRQRDAALSEIEAVEAEMLAIETQANNEIADIQARTDTELAARRARKDDLRRIVDMTGRALELDQPPPTNGDVQDALDKQTYADAYSEAVAKARKEI